MSSSEAPSFADALIAGLRQELEVMEVENLKYRAEVRRLGLELAEEKHVSNYLRSSRAGAKKR